MSGKEYCEKIPSELSSVESEKDQTLPQDGPCVENKPCDSISQASSSQPQSNLGTPRGNVASQTRTDTGSNPDNPYSASKPVTPRGGDANGVCHDEGVKLTEPRNPITGLGLNGDGVGGWKPKMTKQREGNPVTGEGYNGSVNVNAGVHPVINKNRVPPGGFSSGLW